jgi:hypothetical protein
LSGTGNRCGTMDVVEFCHEGESAGDVSQEESETVSQKVDRCIILPYIAGTTRDLIRGIIRIAHAFFFPLLFRLDETNHSAARSYGALYTWDQRWALPVVRCARQRVTAGSVVQYGDTRKCVLSYSYLWGRCRTMNPRGAFPRNVFHWESTSVPLSVENNQRTT